jgi:hypothetical protein
VVLLKVRVLDLDLVSENLATTTVWGDPDEIQIAVVSLNLRSRHSPWAGRRPLELDEQILRECSIATRVVRSDSELEVPVVVEATHSVRGKRRFS